MYNAFVPTISLSSDRISTWIPDIFAFSEIIIEAAKNTVENGMVVSRVVRGSNIDLTEYECEKEDIKVVVKTGLPCQKFGELKVKDCGIDVIEYKIRYKGYWFECRYSFEDEDERDLQVFARMRPEKARTLILEYMRKFIE